LSAIASIAFVIKFRKQLLQLDSISFDPRQRFCRFGVSHYALLVQIAAHQGKGVPDELIYVKRGPVQITLLEDGSNAFDYRCRPR
jgi:hypothetical protein